MTKLNRINQEMVEEVLPTGTTSGTNPYDYGEVKAKKTEKKLYTQAELDEAIDQNNKKAFDMLSLLGVSKERAITVWNGIEVLSTRYRKDRAGYEYNIKEAVKAEKEAWIIKMLSIRDIIIDVSEDENGITTDTEINEIADEIYHFVYTLADPQFLKTNPWEEWETIRARIK